jgi:hypothetical protein
MTAEDRLGVMELLLNYGRCLDAKDAAGYAANFAPDGVRSDDRPGPRGGRFEGRDAIRAVAQATMDSWAVEVRHMLGQPIIEGNNERCRASSYCQVVVQMESGPCAIAMLAEYQDVCVKVDGRWLFQERYTKVLLEAPGTLKRKQ